MISQTVLFAVLCLAPIAYGLTTHEVDTLTAATDTEKAQPLSGFFEAVHAGDLKRVESLLPPLGNADVNAVDIEGKTALMIAANGSLDMVRLLVKHGANLEMKDARKQRTALFYAADAGRDDAVRLLLELGADVNSKDFKGRTVLMVACKRHFVDMANFLIDQKADVTVKTTTNCTVLMYASKGGDVALIRRLLDLSPGSNINDKDDEGETALNKAAGKGHADAIRLLVERGADIEASAFDDGTSLVEAANENHVDAVRVLLELGANPNATDYKSRSAMYWAAKYNSIEIVRLLLKHNAAVDIVYKKGWSPLHEAADGGFFEIVGLLLDAGASIDATTNKNQHSALTLAVRNGSLETVRVLLDKGANVKLLLKDGWTALHYAADYGYASIIRLLMERGADLLAETSSGEIAFERAYKKQHKAASELLLFNVANSTTDYDMYFERCNCDLSKQIDEGCIKVAATESVSPTHGTFMCGATARCPCMFADRWFKADCSIVDATSKPTFRCGVAFTNANQRGSSIGSGDEDDDE